MQKNFSSLSQAEENGTNIQVVLERISGLHSDVNELKESTKDSMKEIAQAINRLVSIEERQQNNHEATTRLLLQIEKLDQRVQAIERDEGVKKLTSRWTIAAVWGVVTVAAGYCAKVLGIL
jgi:chromosome segregation ATPase